MYNLTGEIQTDQWFETEEQAFDHYNSCVEMHNKQLDKEEDHYAYVKIRRSGSASEFLPDGTVREQWPSPTRGHGMLFLEFRPSTYDYETAELEAAKRDEARAAAMYRWSTTTDEAEKLACEAIYWGNAG